MKIQDLREIVLCAEKSMPAIAAQKKKIQEEIEVLKDLACAAGIPVEVRSLHYVPPTFSIPYYEETEIFDPGPMEFRSDIAMLFEYSDLTHELQREITDLADELYDLINIKAQDWDNSRC